MLTVWATHLSTRCCQLLLLQALTPAPLILYELLESGYISHFLTGVSCLVFIDILTQLHLRRLVHGIYSSCP